LSLAKPLVWRWVEGKCRDLFPSGYGTILLTIHVKGGVANQVDLEKVKESFREDIAQKRKEGLVL